MGNLMEVDKFCLFNEVTIMGSLLKIEHSTS
jgi:hypothetical protein